MSDEEDESSVLEKIEEKTRQEETVSKKKEKNPNRVKAGHKLAIGQKAKEEKMRKKVEDSMIKPKTWVSIGIIIGGICVSGVWFGVLPVISRKKEEKPSIVAEEKPAKKENKYFG